MTRIYINLPDYTACGFHRAYLPWTHCKDTLAQEGIELVADTKLASNSDFDVYIFHRVVTDKFFPQLQKLKDRGKTMVWEVDDLLDVIPPYNPVTVTDEQLERLDECFKLADLILVTTDALVEELGYPDKTIACPNLIDLSVYPPVTEKDDDEFRVLWAGSPTHTGDLAMVVNDLHTFKGRYPDARVTFFGQEIRAPGFEYVAAVPHGDFIATLTALNPHVGLAPLASNRFNSCKSAIKWYEYTAVGAVTVASPFGPYSAIRHGTDGLLAYSDEWADTLGLLIQDREMRHELSRAARERVEKEFSWQGEGKDIWLEFFRGVSERYN